MSTNIAKKVRKPDHTVSKIMDQSEKCKTLKIPELPKENIKMNRSVSWGNSGASMISCANANAFVELHLEGLTLML